MTSDRGSIPTYRVAVFAAPDDPRELARVLELCLGMHATDALFHARSAPGVLAIPLDRPLAERVTAGIVSLGVQAAAVAEADLPDFSRAAVVHHARCLETGLEIVELHGVEAALVPWSDVELLSIGQVPQETARHYLAAESVTVRAARRTGPTTVQTPLPPGPEAWVLCARPSRIFRIDHKRMNYEYLGDRKSESATANFRLFIDDVVSHARGAYLTPSTRAYLEHGSVADYSFDSMDELQRATEIHLLLHTHAGGTHAMPTESAPQADLPV
jgi:hypothetical protein